MTHDMIDRLIERLPVTPHILGRERYFNSAVLVPLVDRDGEPHLLFEKRAEGIRQASEICFPGGMHDPKVDTSCRETALRETMEELGLTRERITVLGRFDTLVASIGATVDAFLGRLDIRGLDALSVNTEEVAQVFTLPLSFFVRTPPETYMVRMVVEPCYTDRNGNTVVLLPAKDLGLPPMYHKPWGKARHRILVYKTDFGVIWGITAEIIHDMVTRINRPDEP
ncbi:NUDIX domain-containing protein [Desulfatiferula olefinivorans]